MKPTSFSSIVTKTAIVHTVTYFLVGLLSFVFLDYSAKYADPVVSQLMRQTNDPWVAAGPAFRISKGKIAATVLGVEAETVWPRTTVVMV